MRECSLCQTSLIVVGSKAKGQISKRVLQENKARQFFRKTNISYPLREKTSKFGVLSGTLCPIFSLNKEKYGPKKIISQENILCRVYEATIKCSLGSSDFRFYLRFILI